LTDGAQAASPSPSRNDALDALRGLAALTIFVFHFFALYPRTRGAVFEPLTSTVLGYFGQAVPLFYALSGLSLCLGFFERRTSPKFLREFLLRRFMRIAPLFYFAVIVWTLLFSSLGAPPETQRLLATVTFVFNLLPGYHESVVAAGWSVGVEMLFYLLFPAIVTFVGGIRSALVFYSISCVVAVVSFRYLAAQFPNATYPNMCSASNLHYFAAGILVYFSTRPRAGSSVLRRRASIAITIGLCVGVAVSIWFLTSPRFLGLFDSAVTRVIWTIPLACLLALGARHKNSGARLRPFARVGEWSYSIYLLHPILIHFLFEYMKSRYATVEASTCFGVFFLVGLVGLITCASLTFGVVERPFMRLGARWARAAT